MKHLTGMNSTHIQFKYLEDFFGGIFGKLRFFLSNTPLLAKFFFVSTVPTFH